MSNEIIAPNDMPAFQKEHTNIRAILEEKSEIVLRSFFLSHHEDAKNENLNLYLVDDTHIVAEEVKDDGSEYVDDFRFYESSKPLIEKLHTIDEDGKHLRMFLATTGWVEAHYADLKAKIDKASAEAEKAAE